MSTMVAQMAVGHSDMYHGGIIPTHTAWLSTNGRPAWVLNPTRWGQAPDDPDADLPQWTQAEVVWVPHRPETILEDGLLLLSIHVLRDPSILDRVDVAAPALRNAGFSDLTELDPMLLEELRDRVKSNDFDYKIVLSLWEGNSIKEQLPALADYSMQLEVCTPTYTRTWGGFTSRAEADEQGSLKQ